MYRTFLPKFFSLVFVHFVRYMLTKENNMEHIFLFTILLYIQYIANNFFEELNIAKLKYGI